MIGQPKASNEPICTVMYMYLHECKLKMLKKFTRKVAEYLTVKNARALGRLWTPAGIYLSFMATTDRILDPLVCCLQ